MHESKGRMLVILNLQMTIQPSGELTTGVLEKNAASSDEGLLQKELQTQNKKE